MCRFIAVCAVAASAFTGAGVARAALPLEDGNLLIATGNRVLEYAPNGALAGELVVPRPTGTLRQLGGVALDGVGRLHVHNLGGTANTVGFYDDYLSTYDPAAGRWSHVRVPSEGPNYGSDEDISILGNYVYFNTHRVNLTTGVSTADAPIFGYDTAEVMAGRDGFLYSSARLAADSTRSTLRRHDPQTLDTLATFQLTNESGDPIDIRGVAVDRAGEIYVADWMPGAVHHFDPQGNRVATLDVHGRAALRPEPLRRRAARRAVVVRRRRADGHVPHVA